MRIRFRLLPVTIFVAFLLLSVRVGGFWQQLEIDLGQASVAQDTPTGSKAATMAKGATGKTASSADAGGKKSNKGSMAGAQSEKGKSGTRRAANSKGNTQPDTLASGPLNSDLDPDDLSEAELKVLQELSNRRKQLDQRERNLEMRVGLLKAAEKRVDEKIAQLNAIQAKINSEVKKRDEEKEAQLRSLVKIYEKMKPKDAARIFGRLDLEVLLEVIDRMKEAKTAPILAAMDPSKAKEVTVQLARRRDLAEMPDEKSPKEKK